MRQPHPLSRILVPVEFWRASPHAIEDKKSTKIGGYDVELPPSTTKTVELALALANGGAVRLFHATPSLAYTSAYVGPEVSWIPGPTIREIDEQAVARAKATLEELSQTWCASTETKVEVVVEAGETVTRILDQATAFEADAIVLGASGRGRAGRFFLGSTADKIIRRATCPVLVVPCPTKT